VKVRRRTEVKVETRKTTTVRYGRGRTMIRCERCRTETPHLSLAQAQRAFSLSEAAIVRLAGAGQIHSRENADGRLLLCEASLAAPRE
jgi:hypothetical protein